MTDQDPAPCVVIDREEGEIPPPPPTPQRGPRTRLLIGIAIVAAAFNLRCAIASVGPVLREIIQATHLSPAGASTLMTLPSLCFALSSPTAPRLSARFGTERILFAAMLCITAGSAWRGWGGSVALFGGQSLAALGVGVINVLLPGLIKRDFPDRVASMTGLYTMALCAGAGLAAGVTVPIATLFDGSWDAALSAWAVPALMALAAWAFLLPSGGTVHRSVARVSGLWRQRLAWSVTAFMGLQSSVAFVVIAWLAPMLRDRGFTAGQAGYALSLSILCQAASSLVAPWLATRGKDQRLAGVVSAAICAVALVGCFAGPPAVVWICVVLLGISQGALFSLALTVIVLRSEHAAMAAALSGMAQGWGYLIASFGPFVAGLLRGWSGNWSAVLLFSIGLCVAIAVAALDAGRARYVRS